MYILSTVYIYIYTHTYIYIYIYCTHTHTNDFCFKGRASCIHTFQAHGPAGPRTQKLSALAEVKMLMEDIRRSPVEVGNLSHYLQGFLIYFIPGGWEWDF